MSKYNIVPGAGDPCPRCKQPTQIREHTFLTDKHLRQPFYYWFYCENRRCRTSLIMPERFKVLKQDQELWA